MHTISALYRARRLLRRPFFCCAALASGVVFTARAQLLEELKRGWSPLSYQRGGGAEAKLMAPMVVVE